MLYIYDFKVEIQNTLVLRFPFKTNNQRFMDKKAKMDQLYTYIWED